MDFGNGFLDVLSTFSAMGAGSVSLTIGELVGKMGFVVKPQLTRITAKNKKTCRSIFTVLLSLGEIAHDRTLPPSSPQW